VFPLLSKEIQKSGKNGRRIFRSISVFGNFSGTGKVVLLFVFIQQVVVYHPLSQLMPL
jgi:hypothetical protein